MGESALATAISNNDERSALALLERAGRPDVMQVVECPWVFREPKRTMCPKRHPLFSGTAGIFGGFARGRSTRKFFLAAAAGILLIGASLAAIGEFGGAAAGIIAFALLGIGLATGANLLGTGLFRACGIAGRCRVGDQRCRRWSCSSISVWQCEVCGYSVCANCNIEKETGTVLHIAAHVGASTNVITRLLAIGGEELLDARGSSGKTARQIAMDRSHAAAVLEMDQWERAPTRLAYDAHAASNLIVGVEENLVPVMGFGPGVPPAKFEAMTILPEGVTLNSQTGELVAKLVFPVTECLATIRAHNDLGESVFSVVLSARRQTAPHGLTYAASVPPPSEFAIPPQSTGLCLVGIPLSIQAACEHQGTPPGVFTVDPPLPDGLSLDTQSGVISGKPCQPAARRCQPL